LIQQRQRWRSLSRGSLELLQPDNRRVLAFVREYEDERILVVANLSRFVQGAEIPLAKFQGLTPMEMFGRTEFPPITDRPYFISLGPHSFYWFVLEAKAAADAALRTESNPQSPPLLSVQSWEDPFSTDFRI